MCRSNTATAMVLFGTVIYFILETRRQSTHSVIVYEEDVFCTSQRAAKGFSPLAAHPCLCKEFIFGKFTLKTLLILYTHEWQICRAFKQSKTH